MTKWDVFLCHSKKDRSAMISLHDQLVGDGFTVWLDDNEILPGQKWETAIEDGIENSAIILVCFSSLWVNDKSYAHREYRLALEIMKDLPDDKVFIIPARLDDCPIPRDLRHLQWVNLFEATGYQKLKKSLAVNIGSKKPVAPAVGRDAAIALAKELGFEFVEIDPYQGDQGDNPQQQALLDFFRDNSPLTRSHDFLEANDYPQIITLWSPLESNPYFNVTHTAWAINSLIRMYVFRAKTDLCVAHIRIDWSGLAELKPHLLAAIEILRGVVQMDPFTEDNSDLPDDVKRIQNNDYRDLCRLALNWYKHWGTVLSDVTEISKVTIRGLMTTIENRLEELIQLVGT